MFRTHIQTSLCMIDWYFLDHIIPPFFLLGTFFHKVSFLITTELLSCEMSFYSWRECSSFLFFLYLAWFLGLDCHLFFFSHKSIVHSSICGLLEQLSWLNLERHYAFASLTTSSKNSNSSLRWDLLCEVFIEGLMALHLHILELSSGGHVHTYYSLHRTHRREYSRMLYVRSNGDGNTYLFFD